ncbi:hypothetical protein SAMN05443244_0967 [Terriglobus roseus]|uniref:Uncharacterized protein n=1 Tax=Terriglobus roseus TaxID=392734 RepID=A0A1H4K2A9_9BACT|nr:hypothetical protein SAMN05443244_0967 [Terriglobus roseus]
MKFRILIESSPGSTARHFLVMTESVGEIRIVPRHSLVRFKMTNRRHMDLDARNIEAGTEHGSLKLPGES